MRDTSIKAILGGTIQFHSDLPKVDKESLIGVPGVVYDARIVEGWDSEFGTSDFALIAFEREGGEKVTYLCGGRAVVRQIRRLMQSRHLPGRVKCFLNKVPGKNGQDYFLLDDIPAVEAEPVAIIDKTAVAV